MQNVRSPLVVLLCLISIPVSIPSNVKVTALNTQTVGQPLTLECNVTTVRGITSRVDIVWSRNGEELSTIENVNVTSVLDTSAIYTAYYDIIHLITTDENRLYQCQAVIGTDPVVMRTGSLRLDVIGMTMCACMLAIAIRVRTLAIIL